MMICSRLTTNWAPALLNKQQGTSVSVLKSHAANFATSAPPSKSLTSLRLHTHPPSPAIVSKRLYSSSKSIEASDTAPNPRWIGAMKARIGKCITFGMSPIQMQRAGSILKVLAEEWRELLAGSEGFLIRDKESGRLRAGLYRQEVVWGEMDVMGHVNNVTYTRYAESGRGNWNRMYALHLDKANEKLWNELWSPKGLGVILKSIKTDYKFPMEWPDHITVVHRLSKLPSATGTSFMLDVMIISEKHQRIAARCAEDIVVYDYRAGQKAQIPEFMTKAFQRSWDEQVKEIARIKSRRAEIEEEVEALEQETWNNEHAVEDMGSVAVASGS